MKYPGIILILFASAGCTQNNWISQDAVRPKKAKFRILKEPFIGHKSIDNNYLYFSIKQKPVSDGYLVDAVGFYEDGRFIGNTFLKTELPARVSSQNSWETANNVGYYTTKEQTVEVECFQPYGGGEYERRKGIIKTDTIIFFEKFLGWRETRYDTLVKSKFPLK